MSRQFDSLHLPTNEVKVAAMAKELQHRYSLQFLKYTKICCSNHFVSVWMDKLILLTYIQKTHTVKRVKFD